MNIAREKTMHVPHCKSDLQSTPEALILHLAGDAGLPGIDELAHAADATLAAEPTLLLIEASGLTYIGSMGLGVLMRLRNGVIARGGRVAIVGTGPEVSRLLRHLHIERVMPMHATVAEALRIEVARQRVPAA